MRYRVLFLFGSVALVCGGLIGLGCSNKPLPDDEAGTEGGTGDENTVDTGKPDSKPDQMSGMPCPNFPFKGTCDPVLQNCPNGDQCIMAPGDGGAYSPQCQPPSTGSVPKGGKCSSTSDCVSGTECIPANNGRCSPYCCGMGMDQPCGSSVPEGYIGACQWSIQYPNTPSPGGSMLCGYPEGCKPFGIQPCAQGSTCLVKDMSGKADCTAIANPPGKAAGASCMFANDCADGMMCVGGGPDGGSICMWACYSPPGPFDGGIISGGPGKGGCPNGKTCSIGIGMLPTWLKVCTP